MRGAGSEPLTPLSPQTGQVLEKGPVLQLHNLKREAGGGYRCVATVPSVPGLNRTRLVHVAIFGEGPSGQRSAAPPSRAVSSSWEFPTAPCCPGMLRWGREAG